jgi:hypothetical protein
VKYDRISIDVDVIDDVLGAAFHVARSHACVDAGPSTDCAFDAIGADDDARADLGFACVGFDRHSPRIAVATHRRRFHSSADLRTSGSRLVCDCGLESRAVENVAYVTFCNANRRPVRGAEDDARDASRDPGLVAGSIGVVSTIQDWREKFAETRSADAFTASHGCSNCVVAFEQNDREIATCARCLTSGDEPGGATADDENIAIFDVH